MDLNSKLVVVVVVAAAWCLLSVFYEVSLLLVLE